MINAKSLLFNSILLGLLCTATINFGMEKTEEKPEHFLQLYIRTSYDYTKYHPMDENGIIGKTTIDINKNYESMHLGYDVFNERIMKKVSRRYINCSLIRNKNDEFSLQYSTFISNNEQVNCLSKYSLPAQIITKEQFSVLLDSQKQKPSEKNKDLALIISNKYNIYQITEVIDEDFADDLMRENDTQTNREKLSTEFTNILLKKSLDKQLEKQNEPKAYLTRFRILTGIGILLAIIYFAYKNNLSISDLFKKFSSSSTTT